MIRYAIQFAGHTAVVELISNEPSALQIVPTLFNKHLITADAVIRSSQPIRARAITEEKSYQVAHLEQGPQQTDDPQLFPLLLVQAITDYFVAQQYDGLLLHAAAVSKNGRGILMPGQSGQGKSTLVCWLLDQGFDHLSDEVIYLPTRTTKLIPLIRPLIIKQNSIPILEGFLRANGQTTPDNIYKHDAHYLLPAGKLTQRPSLTNGQLSLIISPQFEPNTSFSLTPLAKSQTVEILMNNFFRRHLTPNHGFPDCVYLARHIPAYRLVYSDFAQLDGVMDRLLS